MFDEKVILKAVERLANRFRVIEEEYLEFISEDLKNVSKYNLNRIKIMKKMRQNIDKIQKKIMKETNITLKDFEKILLNVAEEQYLSSSHLYKNPQKPFVKNLMLKRLIYSQLELTANTLLNIAKTTSKTLGYSAILDTSITKIALGTDSYNSELNKIIKEYASKGIQFIEYESGYKRRLDSSVRQNLITGIKNINQETAKQIGEEFGADGYEVSVHNNPRPSHVDIQGKQYSLKGSKKIKGIVYPNYSVAESRLNEFNCYHFSFPIILGVSEPSYSKQELTKQKKQDIEEVEYDGLKKTRYEWSQVQRQLESDMRTQKNIKIMSKKSDNKELFDISNQKLNYLKKKYSKLAQSVQIEPKKGY